MARPLRIEYSGAFLKQAQGKYGYLLHCYVLTTNHYHLLIETPMGNLSRVNPVRAKLVEKPQDYPYSSYSAYISRDKTDMVYRDLILSMVSKSKKDAIYV